MPTLLAVNRRFEVAEITKLDEASLDMVPTVANVIGLYSMTILPGPFAAPTPLDQYVDPWFGAAPTEAPTAVVTFVRFAMYEDPPPPLPYSPGTPQPPPPP
jgi:hypothetical protein